MSSQASLSRSSAVGPLSPLAGAATSAASSCRNHRRRSWGTLAFAAAALSSAASVRTAAAFVSSPLHGTAPGRVAPPVGSSSDCTASGGGSKKPQHCGCDCASGGPKCPPLVMVLTDPETLLRDADMEARMWRRSRGVGPSSSSSAESGVPDKVDAAYLEGLSKLRLDIDGDLADLASASDFPSALSAVGNNKGGLPEIKVVKTARGRKAKKISATTSVAREPQNIESEIEIVSPQNDLRLTGPKKVESAKAGAARAPEAKAKSLKRNGKVAKASAATAAPLRTVSPLASRPSRASSAAADTALEMAAASIVGDGETGAGTAMDDNESTTKKARPSRSSTMPGFASRKDTARIRGHRDGIALVERRTGKKIRTIDGVGDETTRRRRKKANSEAMYKGSASVPDSLIQFTNEIHEECDRITPHEEIELGTLTQEAIRIQTLHDDLEASLGREPTDEEWCAAAGKINPAALRMAIDEGMEAKNQLVTSNLRMVQGVVNLYIRNGLGSQYNAGDLMQEGILALIRAAEKFDPSRGFRFSTYAMYWIRAAVKRSQVLQSRIVQVPQRLHETHKRILKVEKELRTELGRRPTDAELAKASDLSEAQLERCLKAMAQECHSLDATIQNTLNPNKNDMRRKDTMYDLVDSRTEDDGRKELLRNFSRDSLVDTLRRYLTPHEVDLLLLRYGLMDERTLPHGFSGPLTIAEVSRLVGLKPDKVRRMINGCLRQLRPLIAHEWENFENELP